MERAAEGWRKLIRKRSTDWKVMHDVVQIPGTQKVLGMVFIG